jgi:hypothetical protein
MVRLQLKTPSGSRATRKFAGEQPQAVRWKPDRITLAWRHSVYESTWLVAKRSMGCAAPSRRAFLGVAPIPKGEPATQDFLPAGKMQPMGTILPTGRKFRRNILDSVSCLCASLKGSREDAGGEAPAGKDLPDAIMYMKTQGLRQDMRVSVKSYLIQCKAFNGRVESESEGKRGIEK